MSKNHRIERVMQNLSIDELKATLSRDMLTVFEVIGSVSTLKLVEDFGGTEISVPIGTMRSYQKQKLIDCIGEEATEKFINHFRGERLYVAKCDDTVRFLRNKDYFNVIEQAIKSGMNKTSAVKAFCKEFGICERHSYTVLNPMGINEVVKRHKTDKRQLDLFYETI